jgi:membrane protein implicated in regulation of membrane protease activity
MVDWVRDNAWAAWLGAAAALAVIEMFSLELVLLMFAIGALAAAATAAFGAGAPAALAVFAVVTVGLLWLVRPPLVAKLHAGPTLTTGHNKMVGAEGVVLEPVTDRTGRVHLGGEEWSARAVSPGVTYPVDARVRVLAIDGATAVVTATEELA